MTDSWRWPFAVVAVLTTAVVAGLVASTRQTVPQTAPSALDRPAQTYARLVLALGARDADTLSAEGVREGDRADATLSFAEIAAEAEQTLARLKDSSAGPSARRAHLIAQLDAVAARAAQKNGVTLPWQDELRRMFQFTVNPPHTVDAAARVAALLPGDGDPADRLFAFEGRFIVPPHQLPIVFERALQECRRRTLQHVSLPKGDIASVNYVQGAPWSGFSRYIGLGISQLDVNVSFPLTVDRTLELACHEGYPGHHVFSALRDATLPARWPERDLAPLHSPDAFTSEAVASWAADLVFTDEERLAFERDELFPLAGLNPAGAAGYLEVVRAMNDLRQPLGHVVERYLAGELDFVSAGWALQRDALMARPVATLQFVNQYRGYALAYTLGRDQLTPLLGRHLPEETRWENYRRLATWGTE